MLRAEIKTLHLAEPFRIAHGACTVRHVLRVHDGDAVGEAAVVPYYGESPEEALDWILTRRGESRVGSLALDLLELDRGAEPPWKAAEAVLGEGRPWRGIEACRSIGIPGDLADFSPRIRRIAERFRVIKLKLGSGDPDFDEAIVRTAREVAPGVSMFADVNGGWSVEDTLRMIPRLAPYDLLLLEQPVHHRHGIEAWRDLRKHLGSGSLPVFADESAQKAADVRELAGLADGVNVKLLKCGSFGGGIEMIRAARTLGMGVILGCMIESSIGITAAAHLAPWADHVDLDGHLYLSDDDYCGVGFDENGCLVMPEAPGLGVTRRC